MKIVYSAFDEISRDYREFKTKKEADDFIKLARKEERKLNIKSRWKVYREERTNE